jgi:hypothetical protein
MLKLCFLTNTRVLTELKIIKVVNNCMEQIQSTHFNKVVNNCMKQIQSTHFNRSGKRLH